MSTVIERQVRALGDAAMDAHRDAMAYWKVQDVVTASPGVCEMIVRLLDERRQRHAVLDDSEIQTWVQVCREMLGTLTDVRGMALEMKRRGYEVTGLPELAEGTLAVREMLACMMEPPREIEGMPSFEQLAQVAAANPPSQRWFDDDPSPLRHPRPDAPR
jgi:hypothetical protein